ncbi:glycine-rich cell wall structural protein [Daphnia magna]|nr:glycine-rich cell wall structural protein [Daphnia magna]
MGIPDMRFQKSLHRSWLKKTRYISCGALIVQTNSLFFAILRKNFFPLKKQIKMNKMLVVLIVAMMLANCSALPQFGFGGFGPSGTGAGFGTGQAGFGGASASGVGISSAQNGGFGVGSGSGSAFSGGYFGGQHATGSGHGLSFGK